MPRQVNEWIGRCHTRWTGPSHVAYEVRFTAAVLQDEETPDMLAMGCGACISGIRRAVH